MQIHELNNYTGDIGSNSYMVIDDGTDTGKVTPPQLLAETNAEIKSLSDRVDNIIAGGDAPSASEIVDARQGVGGINYPSLGAAIRGQVENLEENLSSGLTQIGNGKIIETGYIWEHGEISSSTGADIYNANNLRTKGYYSTADIDYVQAISNLISFRIYYYSDNTGTFANSTAVLDETPLAVDKSYPYYRIKMNNKDYSLATDPNVIGYTPAPFQTSIDNLISGQQDITDLKREVNKIKSATVVSTSTESGVTLTMVSKKLLNTDGTLTDFDNSGWAVSDMVDISSYTYLKITAGSGYNHLLYAFYDEDQTFISGENSGAGTLNITQENINIPSGAKYIRVAKNGADSAALVGVIVTYQNSASNTARWAGKKWTVVGDSLTEVNTRTTKHYFDYVADVTGITVVNMGDGGSGYRKEQDQGTAFYQRITNVPVDSDVVTIFGSFNDGLSDLGTATDTGTTTIGGCINTTIDNLYSVMPTVQLGIVSPTPWVAANPYNHPEANAYADLLEEICKRRSIPFLNLYYESNLRPWNAEFRQLAYSKDDGNGVHPDETGHKLIASRFLGFLDSLII